MPKPRVATIAAIVIALIAATLWLWPRRPPPPPPPAPVAAAAPAAPALPRIGEEELEQRVRLAGASSAPAWSGLLGLWAVRANEATIADYILSANYRLSRISDSKVLRTGTLRARTTYNLVESDFASLEAESAARSDAARNLARQLANLVAVGLRSGR